MSESGDRELADAVFHLYDPRARWASLHMRGIERTNDLAVHEAWDAKGRAGDEPPPEVPETQSDWEAWDAGDRIRVQWDYPPDDAFIVVFRGETWWRRGSGKGLLTNGGSELHEHGKGPYELMVETAGLLPALSLTYVGRGAVAHRETFRLRGTPRTKDQWTWNGSVASVLSRHEALLADSYVLDVDIERGPLLRVSVERGETQLFLLEATEAEFDVPFPDDLFVLSPLPDEALTLDDGTSAPVIRTRRKESGG